MKIDPTQPQGLAPYKGLQKNKTSQPAAKPAGNDDPAYTVTLSSAPDPAPVQEDDEARRAKVAAIREQLSSGTYNISGKDVADKILNVLKR